MKKRETEVFSPGVPPDLEHAAQVREEALDWLETRFPGVVSFTTGQVLRMAGELGHRWLISRLRARGIGNEEEFSLPATADALTVLYLRSRGVKFREAVDAVLGGKGSPRSPEPRYGGIWNRLLVTALDRLRRRVPPRLLGSALFSLLPNREHQPNCLAIVKRHGRQVAPPASQQASTVSHEYVYRTILERPAPSCSVIAPSLEVLFLGKDQLPARSEVTSRHFVGLHVATEQGVYELLVGTMRPASLSVDGTTLEFVGKILDLVFPHFEEFQRSQSSLRLETTTEPGAGSADDLQLWLITQFLSMVYPGSLCEVIETSPDTYGARALASSAAKPWEPSLWPPGNLEMLSGYASLTGVPLVVETVEHPWSAVVKSVEPEMRYLRSMAVENGGQGKFSALALPFVSRSGDSKGSLYMLVPRLDHQRMDVEVRILRIFSLVLGEIIERQRAASHSADVYANIATLSILKQEQFKSALLELLSRKAGELQETELLQRHPRLPFLLLAAHRPEPDEYDPATSGHLRDWLVETLRHLEWRSFVRSHWSGATDDYLAESFIGEFPGVGLVIALGRLVSKEELDQIRSAFPTTINRISPTNAPVKLVAWVLDVPAARIQDAARREDVAGLADDVERWVFEVATVVDDVTQSSELAHDRGEWDMALRRVRRSLRKDGARNNSYLRRIAADCAFSLGHWPSALKYAQEAVALSRHEMGSGLVRSLCQEGDAHLCLGDPVAAWDRYSEAASEDPGHPLPRHYRGQALLLMARLFRVYEDELRRTGEFLDTQAEQIAAVLASLANGAMEDLTDAADLLDGWGLIPASYQYRNFHLIPTLLGLGAGYLLMRNPGPAASRLQSARRSFPKDDLFFREYLFAKCWEQGVHRRYGELLLGNEWPQLRDRLLKTFGAPPELSRSGLRS